RARALVLAAARFPRRSAGELLGGRHPAGADYAQVVRAALYRRLRAPRLAHGLLAQAAEAGAGRRPGLRQRSLLTDAWPTSHPSISPPGSTSRKWTTPSTRRRRKSRSVTTSRARARPST